MIRYIGLLFVIAFAIGATRGLTPVSTQSSGAAESAVAVIRDVSQPTVYTQVKNKSRAKSKNNRRLKPNGKADNTAALQRLVDSKTGSIRLRKGVYRITRPIVIDLDQVGYTSISSDGTATIAMDGPGPALRFVGTHGGTADPASVKDNVWDNQRTPMLTGIEIIGRHADADGVEADGTMQLTISKVVLRKLRHGIHLVNRNRNVIVDDCHIYQNSGVGIYYDQVNLHQSNIIGSHISYNAGGGIVVRGGDVRNIHIGTCDIEGNMSSDGSPTANVLLDSTGGSIGEVAITGCTIQHSHNAKDSANIRVNGESTARSFTSETRHGHITIANNVLSDVRINIDLLNTRGVTITGNTIWKGYDHDIRLQNCAHIVLGSNMFDRNPRYGYGDGENAKQGLLFTDCRDCTLTGNHIVSAGDTAAAIEFSKCSRINMTGGSVLDAKHVGILLTDVTRSRISNCIIDNSNSPAAATIRINGGSGNMIVNNQLSSDLQTSDLTAHIDGNSLAK